MAKIKNDKGEEIEVVTPEEAAAKLEQEKAVWQAEADAKVAASQAALTAAQEEKAELERQLEAARNNGGVDSDNFATVKQKLKDKDKEIADANAAIKKIESDRVSDLVSDALRTRVKGDSELEKKVKFHYDTTLAAMKGGNRDEVNAKMDAAMKLAGAGPAEADLVNGANYGAAGYGTAGAPANNPTEWNAAQRAMAAKLGISEKELTDYGKRIK